MSDHRFERVVGVDFSGAAIPGKLIWIAACEVLPDAMLRLASLRSLDELCGRSERDECLGWLVDHIARSGRALWGMDFPFSLPIEIAGAERDQLKWVKRFEGNAYDFGRVCVSRAMNLGEKLHLRRDTDIETKTPFDCYHYRIVCQTFHGMRDVLLPLRSRRGVAVVPLEMRKMARAETIVVEACPGSTLKRMGLPRFDFAMNRPAGSSRNRNARCARRFFVVLERTWRSIVRRGRWRSRSRAETHSMRSLPPSAVGTLGAQQI